MTSTFVGLDGAPALSFGVVTLVKVTVVLLLGGLAVVAARRQRATVRHTIWVVTLAGTLFIPLGMAGMPRWQLRVLPPRQAVPASHPRSGAPGYRQERALQQPAVTELAPAASGAVGLAGATRSTPSRAPRQSATEWLQLLWLTGVIVGFVRLAVGHLGLRRVERAAEPLTSDPWQSLLAQERARAEVTRPVSLLMSSTVSMPVTWGIARPVVVLPSAARGWTHDQRRVAIRHELAHIARNDAATQLWSTVACAVYWFHPLVWLAARRLRGECERACDERVVALGTPPAEYAAQLVHIARSAHALGTQGLISVAMARPSHLEQRVAALLFERHILTTLDVRRDRRLRSQSEAVTGMLAILILVPLAMVHPAAKLWHATPSVPRAAMVTTGPAKPRSAVFTATPCDSVLSDRSSLHVERSAADVVTLSWSDDRCSGSVHVEGDVRLTDDGMDVVQLSPRGIFTIEERVGRTVRRIEILADSSGRMTRRWIVDGGTQSYGAEAQDWLAAALASLRRHGGLQHLTAQRPPRDTRWVASADSAGGVSDQVPPMLPSDSLQEDLLALANRIRQAISPVAQNEPPTVVYTGRLQDARERLEQRRELLALPGENMTADSTSASSDSVASARSRLDHLRVSPNVVQEQLQQLARAMAESNANTARAIEWYRQDNLQPQHQSDSGTRSLQLAQQRLDEVRQLLEQERALTAQVDSVQAALGRLEWQRHEQQRLAQALRLLQAASQRLDRSDRQAPSDSTGP